MTRSRGRGSEPVSSPAAEVRPGRGPSSRPRCCSACVALLPRARRGPNSSALSSGGKSGAKVDASPPPLTTSDGIFPFSRNGGSAVATSSDGFRNRAAAFVDRLAGTENGDDIDTSR